MLNWHLNILAYCLYVDLSLLLEICIFYRLLKANRLQTVIVTHSNGSHIDRVFSSIYVFDCRNVSPHDISKTDAARNTKPWVPETHLFWNQIVRIARHKNCWHGSWHPCEWWLLLAMSVVTRCHCWRLDYCNSRQRVRSLVKWHTMIEVLQLSIASIVKALSKHLVQAARCDSAPCV